MKAKRISWLLPALAITCLAAQTPQSADELHRQGVSAFELGQIERSVEAFDALVAMFPERRPALWQRGISLYYANRLEDCVAQFASHRSANPDDVENSVWHYLCVAAIRGEQAARDGLLPAEDARIPMMSIHRLFAGTGDADAVFDEVLKEARNPEQRRVGSFYAHLYVALWFESRGDAGRTRHHLEQALEGTDIGHYMEKVARVHLNRMKAGSHWAAHPPDPQDRFFAALRALCGARFEGQSSFPEDPGDAFRGKTLVAVFETCSDDEIRIPFHVGEDTSRTWILTRVDGGLRLKHDHRHQDGTPDEITMYGGTTTHLGSKLSQSFPADAHTAGLIPEAATNQWFLRLNPEATALTYYLERHGEPRFEATLRRVSSTAPGK